MFTITTRKIVFFVLGLALIAGLFFIADKYVKVTAGIAAADNSIADQLYAQDYNCERAFYPITCSKSSTYCKIYQGEKHCQEITSLEDTYKSCFIQGSWQPQICANRDYVIMDRNGCYVDHLREGCLSNPQKQ